MEYQKVYVEVGAAFSAEGANDMNAKSDELEVFIKWCEDGKFRKASEEIPETKSTEERPSDKPQEEKENNY